MNAIQYIILSTFCLSVSYSLYLLLFRNGVNFRHLRFYLLASIVISLLMPLSTYRIGLGLANKTTLIEYVNPTLPENDQIAAVAEVTSAAFSDDSSGVFPERTGVNWMIFLTRVYLIVSTVLLIRIIIQIFLLVIRFYQSTRIRVDAYIMVNCSHYKNSFSFFNWIFINPEFSSREESEHIISHEKVHASQYHTLDLILVELLAAAMWFNPLVWMMRNSIQLVHEYLADEGALHSGIDKVRYQALLINQVSEESLICLSSSFNYSLIKKRIIMMNKLNFRREAKYKIFALLPLIAILFLGVACIKGKEAGNQVTAVELVRMNVLYIGVDNPVKIAASGYETSELEAYIDNGTLSGTNGEYSIKPAEPGRAVLTISCKGKEIQKTEFRVKTVPDPAAVVVIPGSPSLETKSDGSISKDELLKAGGIQVILRNFDFDLSFRVVSFVMSATLPNSNTIVEEISKTDRFSQGQIDLIKSLVKNQKLMIEEIKVAGPDGRERKLSPMVFNVSGE